MRAGLLALAACSSLSLSHVALAQAKPAPPPPAAPEPVGPKQLSEALTGEAKQDYDRGIILYGDSDYPGALSKFAHAYELSHDPRLLWNMATCQKGMRHYFHTYALIEQYLREGASVLSVETIARAEDTKRLLRDLYSPVNVRIEPKTARLIVDGELVTVGADGATGLDLGAHKARVEAEGFEPYEKTIDVPGKTPVDFTATLKPVAVTTQLQVVTEATAVITVDEARPMTGQWDGELAPGKHRIKVTEKGKVPYDNAIDLSAGGHKSLFVPLKDKSAGVPAWVWIGGGILVASAGAVGGYFLFRPKDEAGAAPLGKLGSIALSFR